MNRPEVEPGDDPAPTPPPRRRAVLRYAVSLSLMAAFLYWAFHGIDAGAIWDSARTASLTWLAVIVATTVVTAALRAWRWVVLLRHVAPTVTVVDATLALAICYSANIAVPRAGEAVRALSLKWRRGADLSAVLGTVVVERVIDLVWLVLLIALSAALVPGRIEQSFPGMQTGTIALLAVCVALLAGLSAVSAFGDRGIRAVESALGRVSAPLAARAGGLLGKFLHGLGALHTPSAYAEILVSSILLNLGYAFITFASFAAFGFDEPPWSLGLAEALVVMAISSIGVVVPTPAGTGSYHFFFSRALTALFAVPQAPALACATAIHAVSNLTYLAIGLPAFLAQRLSTGGRRPPC